MSSPADLDNIEGETVNDQDGRSIGKVREVCGKDGDGQPMWVVVDASFGLMQKRTVILPVARLKEEGEEILVPYSLKHVEASPEIEPSDELSVEDDRALRDHYGIDRADQELRDENESYASRVVDGPGSPPEEAYEVDKHAAERAMKKDDEESESEGPDTDSEESQESEDDSEEPQGESDGKSGQQSDDRSGEKGDDGPSAFEKRFRSDDGESDPQDRTEDQQSA
jgi:hypothetical protein